MQDEQVVCWMSRYVIMSAWQWTDEQAKNLRFSMQARVICRFFDRYISEQRGRHNKSELFSRNDIEDEPNRENKSQVSKSLTDELWAAEYTFFYFQFDYIFYSSLIQQYCYFIKVLKSYEYCFAQYCLNIMNLSDLFNLILK